MRKKFDYRKGDRIGGFEILKCVDVQNGMQMYESFVTENIRVTLTVLPDEMNEKWSNEKDNVILTDHCHMFQYEGKWIQVTKVRRNLHTLQEVFDDMGDCVVDCHSALIIALRLGRKLFEMKRYGLYFSLEDLCMDRIILSQDENGEWDVDFMNYGLSHRATEDVEAAQFIHNYPIGLSLLLEKLTMRIKPEENIFLEAFEKKPTAYAGVYEWDRNKSLGASSLLTFLSEHFYDASCSIDLDFDSFRSCIDDIHNGIVAFMETHHFPTERMHKLQIMSIGSSSSMRPALHEEGPKIYYADNMRINDETGEVTEISDSATNQTGNDTPIQGQVQTPVNFKKSAPDAPGFEDVAGMADLKKQLKESVLFVMQHKDLMEKYRLKPLNGMLLYGPPGCGKSFIAEKFAEESHMSYAFVKSSDLANIYLHGSQTMIADLFKKARAQAPCIICIDEVDAMLSDRMRNSDSQEFCREVNEFLTQLNNCGKDGVFVIGTTNRPELLDPAVMRAGRLEKHVYVPCPDLESRKELWTLALKDRPLAEDINVDILAAQTEGYVAADLELIADQVALQAALKETCLTQEMLEEEIKRTPRSLTPQLLQSYDRLRDSMEGKEKVVVRPRIGFTTSASTRLAS